MAKINGSASKCLILFVRSYQCLISPFMAQCCRYYPSCSSYTINAIEQHGFWGCFIALKRILRCHPWHPGGYDPVPEKISK